MLRKLTPQRRSASAGGRLGLLIPFVAMVLGLAGCSSDDTAGDKADLVLRGGQIVTLAEPPVAEAIAVQGGRIAFVGSEADVEAWIGRGTEVVDLAGATAHPGLIEGHGHFLGLGEMKLQLDLTQATTWQEIVDLVAAQAAQLEPGSWILGRGWHQDKWSEVPAGAVDGVPVHASLSAVTPDHPVYLTHASGHAAFVNAKALELAGIDADTADPDGGTIVREASGAATGLLREKAQGLAAAAHAGGWDEARRRRAAELAAEESLRHGITSFQDAGSSIREVDFLIRLAEEGALPLRLWVMVRDDNEVMADNLARVQAAASQTGDYLTVGGIKKSIDGALGSHGAWLLEPYTDLPSTSGLNTIPVAEVDGAAALALEHDMQLCVHAIGDRANREVLDLYERRFGELGEEAPSRRRWRIEHAQHLSLEDIPRFGSLGVVASMQGVHCTSDGPWVPDRIGDQRAEEGAYVWRKLIETGAVVSNGTDAPVEPVDPLASYHASLTRLMRTGETFYPDQVMTREEALRSYTVDAAYAAFQEDSRGTLEVGKLADVTVLSGNLLTMPVEEIRDAEVRYTIVGGRIAYSGADS